MRHRMYYSLRKASGSSGGASPIWTHNCIADTPNGTSDPANCGHPLRKLSRETCKDELDCERVMASSVRQPPGIGEPLAGPCAMV